MSTQSWYQRIINTDSRIRINAQNKVISAHALPGKWKCIVKKLDKYLSLLHPDAPYFYMLANEESCEVGGSTFTKELVSTC